MENYSMLQIRLQRIDVFMTANNLPDGNTNETRMTSSYCQTMKEEPVCLFHSEVDLDDIAECGNISHLMPVDCCMPVERSSACTCGVCCSIYENKHLTAEIIRKNNMEKSKKTVNTISSPFEPDFGPIDNYYCYKSKLEFCDDKQTQTILQEGKRKYKHMCKICKCEFGQRYHYRHHLKIHYPGFECGACPAQFYSRKHLIQHIQLHTLKKFYECGFCNVAYTKKRDFKKHVLTHEETKLLSCKHCPAKFEKKNALEVHQKTHSSSGGLIHIFRKVKSDLGNVVSTTVLGQDDVTETVKNIQNNFFSCSQCKRLKFSTYKILQKHKLIHSRRKGNSICERCDARFPKSGALKRHSLFAHTS